MTDAAAEGPRTIAGVLADVDGTLVTNAKELTPRAIEAVKLLHERGVLFAITSGRPPRGMRMLVDPLELRGPIAAFNGGIMVHPDMTIIDERAVPASVAPAVIDAIRAHGLYAWIYREAQWYVTDPHAPHIERECRTVQFQPTVVPSYDDLLDRVVKIVGVSDDYTLVARCEAALRAQFGSHVSAARSQPYYVDVTHPLANKGVVVQRLSEHSGIPLSQVVTLGDQPNDVLMFKRSGMSIAMGNASSDVQHAAMWVTASNEDEGFAKAVEEFILPRAVAAPAAPAAPAGSAGSCRACRSPTEWALSLLARRRPGGGAGSAGGAGGAWPAFSMILGRWCSDSGPFDPRSWKSWRAGRPELVTNVKGSM